MDSFSWVKRKEGWRELRWERNALHSSSLLNTANTLVERRDSEFATSVYRKLTFTGQYLRWNSFSPNKRKINLIGTLVHRAFKICSKGKLDAELDKILSILLENGYPENLIKSTIKRKLQQLNSNPVHTVKKNAQSTYTFHGSETFRRSSKSRSRLPWSVASFPLNHMLFLRPDSSYQQPGVKLGIQNCRNWPIYQKKFGYKVTQKISVTNRRIKPVRTSNCFSKVSDIQKLLSNWNRIRIRISETLLLIFRGLNSGKSCTLHNHSFSIFRRIVSDFCAMTPSLSMVQSQYRSVVPYPTDWTR